MAEDRIDKLAEPFRTHAPAASRRLTSLYLDGEVVSRLDKAYRDCNYHHPVVLSKSVFLETLIEYGLAHLEELKPLLQQAAEGDAAAYQIYLRFLLYLTYLLYLIHLLGT